jgi:hypothetical protein
MVLEAGESQPLVVRERGRVPIHSPHANHGAVCDGPASRSRSLAEEGGGVARGGGCRRGRLRGAFANRSRGGTAVMLLLALLGSSTLMGGVQGKVIHSKIETNLRYVGAQHTAGWAWKKLQHAQPGVPRQHVPRQAHSNRTMIVGQATWCRVILVIAGE